MILFKQIELLQRLHKFIDQAHTGNPLNLATNLGISNRYLYAVIDEMKDMGAPIEYSRRDETYYYTEPFVVNIVCTFKRLSQEEQKKISAGSIFSQNFHLTDCFVQ
jgi:predicted DNA-binding transcriptional regulator YafY